MDKPNGNTRLVLFILSIVVIVGGWGITWGALRSQVTSHKEFIAELKEKKLDVNVYRSDLKRIEEKLNAILAKIEQKTNNLTR